jgi:DNA-binding winged helix-turn-helix (wHTH) protein
MSENSPNEPRFAFGPFRLFPTRQLLLDGETPVRIGDRARDLLIALLEQPGHAVSKQALSARAWPNAFVEDVTLRAQVAALRKTLRDGQGGRRYIANVAGRGYAFVGEMSAAVAPPPVAVAREPPESAPALSTVQLFGRSEAIETLTHRLAENRLVSIVGPGALVRLRSRSPWLTACAPGCVTAYVWWIWRLSPTPDWCRQPLRRRSASAWCQRTRCPALSPCCAIAIR